MAGIFARAADNRRLFADTVDGLDPSRYDSPTLCTGWSVRVLTAHMLQPMYVGFGRFFLTAIRHRGDTDATVDSIARRIARRPVAELTAVLRERADLALSPPRVGPLGPFADTCLHLRDLGRPLGLDVDVSLADWRTCLDYLVSPTVAPALLARGRLDGLRLAATDQDWSYGDGVEVTGPSEALAMAISGRSVAATDLKGAGTALLTERLGTPHS